VSLTSDRGLVLFRPLILVEDGELWASDDVLETVEPGALMFPEEELVLSPSYLLSLFSRSLSSRFSPYISRMKSKPDLSLDFSSIGCRIRSKKERSSVGSSESMDFSGSSLDLTAEVENLSRKVVDLGPSSAEEITKKNRKRVPAFDGRWTEKFAFMYLPGFSPLWCTAGGDSYHGSIFGREDDQAGTGTPHRASTGPFSSNMSGSKGEEAFAEYKRALEVMSTKKAAPKKAAPSENDDEVQFIKSNKRQAATSLASSSKKKSRASGSTPRVSPTSSNDPAIVLANLNTKVFPLTPVILPEGDSFASIQLNQGDLLQAMSQLFHLGERMDEHASLKVDLAELTSQLREDKKNVLAKEKEIKALRLKVRNQDEAGALAAAENVSLREQIWRLVNGAIVVARCELMKEWLNHQTDSWDLEGPLEQYKMVKTSEAEFQGLPSPTFKGEPTLHSATETEKTLEPVADNPPAS
ncbi:hypothetical protein HID58_087235, partial [Brassica napus]